MPIIYNNISMPTDKDYIFEGQRNIIRVTYGDRLVWEKQSLTPHTVYIPTQCTWILNNVTTNLSSYPPLRDIEDKDYGSVGWNIDYGVYPTLYNYGILYEEDNLHGHCPNYQNPGQDYVLEISPRTRDSGLRSMTLRIDCRLPVTLKPGDQVTVEYNYRLYPRMHPDGTSLDQFGGNGRNPQATFGIIGGSSDQLSAVGYNPIENGGNLTTETCTLPSNYSYTVNSETNVLTFQVYALAERNPIEEFDGDDVVTTATIQIRKITIN